MSGRLIAIEGTDGSGKTTVCSHLVSELRARGHEVVHFREPGGTVLGEQIRHLLLDHSDAPPCPRAEALLFAAQRAQNVHEHVIPALARGAIVLAERMILSSLAYQGVARGLGVEPVRDLSLFALDDVALDGTVFLALPAAAAAARQNHRDSGGGDRIETEGERFFATVSDAYRDLAASDPLTITVSADGTPEQVLERTLRAVLAIIAPPARAA